MYDGRKGMKFDWTKERKVRNETKKEKSCKMTKTKNKNKENENKDRKKTKK